MQIDQPINPILNFRIGLRADLKLKKLQAESAGYVLEDPVSGKFFRLGQNEYEVLKSLNQTQTVQCCLEAHGHDIEDCLPFISRVVEAGLVSGVIQEERIQLRQQQRRKLNWLQWNPLCFKIRFPEATEHMRPFLEWGKFLFSEPAFFVWIGLIGAATIFGSSEWSRLQSNAAGILFEGQWLVFLLIWVLMKLIHELGHALAAHRFGVKPGEVGILFLLFTPMAYIDMTGCWKLENRRLRMIISAAGMYVELGVAALAMIAWSWLPTGIFATVCFHIFMAGTLTTVLFNANPLMRFDGYFLLSDWVKIPNLYGKGSAWLKQSLGKLCLGIQSEGLACHPDESWLVPAYGICAFVWRLIVCLSLTLAACILVPDLALLIGSLGILTWIGIPILFGICRLWKIRDRIQWQRSLTTLGVLLSVLISMFFLLWGPANKTAPALVQFENEIFVRAPADAFVSSILVKDGQRVPQGAVLAQFSNPELQLDKLRLETEVRKSEVQMRIHRVAGDHELASIESEKHKALLAQWEDANRATKQLQVTAPVDGIVLNRNLHQLTGQFLSKGSPFLSLYNPNQKRVILSVEQSDENSLTGLLDQRVQLVMKNRSRIPATVAQVLPKATIQPEHLSLTAARGGPIPVRQLASGNVETRLQFLRPRILVHLSLSESDSSRLAAGERGYAIFPSNAQSLASYFIEQFQDWCSRQLEASSF